MRYSRAGRSAPISPRCTFHTGPERYRSGPEPRTSLPLFAGLGREGRTKVGKRSETDEGGAAGTALVCFAPLHRPPASGRGVFCAAQKRREKLSRRSSHAGARGLPTDFETDQKGRGQCVIESLRASRLRHEVEVTLVTSAIFVLPIGLKPRGDLPLATGTVGVFMAPRDAGQCHRAPRVETIVCGADCEGTGHVLDVNQVCFGPHRLLRRRSHDTVVLAALPCSTDRNPGDCYVGSDESDASFFAFPMSSSVPEPMSRSGWSFGSR
jgi:hypothetical protein